VIDPDNAPREHGQVAVRRTVLESLEAGLDLVRKFGLEVK